MLKKISKERVIYLAGFLDGDGSIYVQAKKNQTYRFGYQIEPAIVFFQSAKSKDKFLKIVSILPYGKMRERKDGIIEYRVSKIADLKEFTSLIEPYLILKKKQIILLRKIISLKNQVKNQQDFQKILDLVDMFRVLNYSKKRLKRVITP